MNEGFADTSGWASAFIKNDPHHKKASELMALWRQENRQVVTTNYVLSELVALLSRSPRGRKSVLNYTQIIRSAPWVEIVHIDKELDAKAWRLLEKKSDKVWSLVDAASFVVMRERGITEALTADKHFEQAGFIRLLV